MDMYELSKTILQRVSFDKLLFRKELVKSLRWVKGDEIKNFKIWCLARFGHLHNDVINEVFDKTILV
jgi:hypothetical protein